MDLNFKVGKLELQKIDLKLRVALGLAHLTHALDHQDQEVVAQDHVAHGHIQDHCLNPNPDHAQDLGRGLGLWIVLETKTMTKEHHHQRADPDLPKKLLLEIVLVKKMKNQRQMKNEQKRWSGTLQMCKLTNIFTGY